LHKFEQIVYVANVIFLVVDLHTREITF
jgi:hypothetical protein